MLTKSAIQCYTPNRSSAELIAEVGLEIAFRLDILNIGTIPTRKKQRQKIDFDGSYGKSKATHCNTLFSSLSLA
jgi:hypothetical protein